MTRQKTVDPRLELAVKDEERNGRSTTRRKKSLTSQFGAELKNTSVNSAGSIRQSCVKIRLR
ncbi:hypothetical protein K0M31_012690, partial [Melipona bicolor]